MQSKRIIVTEFDSIKEKLKKYLEITLGPNLGTGSYGYAFGIGENKALKITVDKLEAENNLKMQKLNLIHYVNVYRVFQFKSLEGIYFNILEKLNPLSENEKEFIASTDSIMADYRIPTKDYLEPLKEGSKNYISASKDRQEALNLIIDFKKPLNSKAKSYLISFIFDEGFNKYDLKTIRLGLTMPRFLNQLGNALYQFAKHKLYNLDSHIGNMGKDTKGLLKFFDFGFESRIPGSQENIETLNANRTIF